MKHSHQTYPSTKESGSPQRPNAQSPTPLPQTTSTSTNTSPRSPPQMPLSYTPHPPPSSKPTATSLPTPSPRIRPFVLATSIVAIVATGSWYGASLKDSLESKKEATKLRTLPLTARIAHLEDRRTALVARKVGLEDKIEEMRERQRVKGEEMEARRVRVKEGGGRGLG